MSTIKQKFGRCLDCTESATDQPLTAKRCQYHYKIYRAEIKGWKAPKRTELKAYLKPIPKVSVKRAKENPKYTIQRLQFLSLPENHRCFIDGCNKRSDTIEHTRGRQGYADDWARDNGITLFMDVRFWKGCCWDHNGELERNPELSQKYQLSKITGKEKLQKQSLKN